MRTWQVERRKRTRHLIELGGLVVKARIVELTGDDRAMIYGTLLWMADKLKSHQGEQARALWVATGRQAFDMDPAADAETTLSPITQSSLPKAGRLKHSISPEPE
ncbi:MAG: conjugal transfer protein TraD [Rhodopseudomonas sp.]|uniref:conjugal transfer protein TraD n=1 Tax=Rhodopseudomonas sp. TaxID=1078 RepID=UPI0039E4A31D